MKYRYFFGLMGIVGFSILISIFLYNSHATDDSWKGVYYPGGFNELGTWSGGKVLVSPAFKTQTECDIWALRIRRSREVPIDSEDAYSCMNKCSKSWLNGDYDCVDIISGSFKHLNN